MKIWIKLAISQYLQLTIQDYKAGILGICDTERKASFCPDRVVII